MENFAEQLETLTRQEQELQFTAFTSDTALALGLKLVEIVRQRGKIVTVNITVNGKVLFHHAMQGAAAAAPVLVKADPDGLQVLLNNLIDNAARCR